MQNGGKYLEQLRKLLSDPKAVKLLTLAHDGLAANVSTFRQLGFSPRVYYSRRQRLIESGLIHKVGDKYVTTELGKLVHRTQVGFLEELAENRGRIAVMERIRDARLNLTAEQIDSISKILFGKTGMLNAILTDVPKRISFVVSYDDLVNVVVNGLKKASNRVYLASRYNVPSIINELTSCGKRGLDVHVVADTNLLAKRLEFLRVDSLEGLKPYLSLLQPFKDSNVKHRYADLSYSFLIVDDKEAGIEVLDPMEPGNFLIGLKVEDEAFCRTLTKSFFRIWDEAVSDAPEVFERARSRFSKRRRST